MEVVQESLYDHPAYYDLLFGAEWRSEFEFLQGCFLRFAARKVKRVFEPACGTGRLLHRLAVAGYDVSGLDLNRRAVEYCNARLVKGGFPASVFTADMADFRLKRPVDAAFNLINSFRHLPDHAAGVGHLRCMAAALAPGGIYALGLHLTPRGRAECTEEDWTAQRGSLRLESHMETLAVDLGRRRERISLTVDVITPSRRMRLEEEMIFRTYQRRQMLDLIGEVSELELVECFDFLHDLTKPVRLTDRTEDVILILRRR